MKVELRPSLRFALCGNSSAGKGVKIIFKTEMTRTFCVCITMCTARNVIVSPNQIIIIFIVIFLEKLPITGKINIA